MAETGTFTDAAAWDILPATMLPVLGGFRLHTNKLKLATSLIAAAPLLVLAACGGGSNTTGQGQPAANQVLRFPVLQDPHTWDPGELNAEVDSEIVQNVFDNLWRFDDKLNIVPDLATTVPTKDNGGISADGMTYTVHLKSNAKFSNGDAVTAKDVIYSWNRGVALRGAYASNLAAIAGYSDVRKAGAQFCARNADVTTCRTQTEQHLAAKDPAFQMTGLTAPDGPNGLTVQIKLGSGCGWCLTAWSLQASTGTVVDENVIKNDPVNWWSKPGEQIGSGAYTMTAYTPKQSIVFKQVPNWWGTPKPTLTEVDIDIKDPSTQTTNDAAWEQGSYDLIGYGGNSQQPQADVLRYQSSSQFKSQLLLQPKGRTTWVSFNIGYASTGGPFVGESDAAKGLRKAFALAVDKNALASSVCHNLTCVPATGGPLTKGLLGYGGDSSDPLAKFDATTAKSLLHQFDPDGTKTANLKYSYNAGGLNDPVATFLQGQWQQNLGVSVTLDPHPDASAFIADRLAGKFVMARDGWQFDYNHPQDWFDNLWGTSACGSNTSGYADNGSCSDGANDPNPAYDSTLAKADAEDVQAALPLYAQLTHMLQTDIAYIPLYYSVGEFLIHPWVKGAGSNTQADFYWDEISLLQH